MKWIKKEYRFPEKNLETTSYFEDCDAEIGLYVYHFRTLQQFRELLKERLSEFNDDDYDLIEICKTAFENKPNDSSDQTLALDQKPVDYIYQLY